MLTSMCLCAVSLRHYIKDFHEETLKKNKALAEEIARSSFNLFIRKKKPCLHQSSPEIIDQASHAECAC